MLALKQRLSNIMEENKILGASNSVKREKNTLLMALFL
jgi:hypothetical protein